MNLRIKPVLVTKEVAEEALRKLAGWDNKSVEEVRRLSNECSAHAIKVMNTREKLGKRAMRNLFEKWKTSPDAKRLFCTKNKAHRMEPRKIIFRSPHDGEILMVCTECDCSYKMPDIVIVLMPTDR